MARFYVYEHWRPDADVCFYVGKGTGDRAWRLKTRAGYHKNVIEKLIRNDFAVDVRIVADELEEKVAHAIEIERIAYWRSLGIALTNRTDGGEGISGYAHTAETRARLGAAAKGRLVSPETRAKMSEVLRAAWAAGERKLLTDEVKAKISEALKGRVPSDDVRAKLVAAQRKRQDEGRGTILSEEAKAKISLSLTGKVRPDEVRAKISATMKGYVPSEEHRANLSASQKGREFSPEHRAKATAALQSPEVRAKISAAAKLRPPMSAETRAKISATKKARAAGKA